MTIHMTFMTMKMVNKMAKNFVDFYNYANGKVWDTNGNASNASAAMGAPLYQGQCVALIKTYLKWGGCSYPARGNAIDYWTNKRTNGILNDCDIVSGAPKNGDIGVSYGIDARYGHIFIYYNGQAFAQNVAGRPVARLTPLSYQGHIVGYLRPKFILQTPQTTTSSTNTYTVKAGDTLSAIAAKYHTTYQELARINGIANPNVISVGQVIKLSAGSTTEAAATTKEAIDDILHVGSYVTSKPMKIGYQGLKNIDGVTCCFLGELGGWFPIDYVSEYDASDGKHDNYLATTDAVVYVDRCKVEAVNVQKNLVQIHGIWVNPAPLAEIA